jgi:Protein of unknown function (DUF2723)
MNYKKINNLTGWAVFLISAIVYIVTMEPHGSLWDCGEFASSAAKIGVPHPPGAPLFVIIGRIFAILGKTIGIGAGGGVALMSALSSAFTILFLFWTITHFAKKIKLKSSNNQFALKGDALQMEVGNEAQLSSATTFDIMAAGVIGALAYTFSDSFWYSAVEAEVYALSSFCTAIVFWAALKWEDHPENNMLGSIEGRNRADKWMILIFFMMGMSIGVHLLNILTIPPIILIYYFKRYKKTTAGTLIALFVSVLILGFVQKAVGQWSIGWAFPFEKLFVNSFNLPVLSGFIFFFILVGFVFYIILRFANKNNYGTLRLSVWCLAFTLIGMSTYLTTMIRAKANPGIDMYNVDNPYALKGYLSREQYGDFPLLYGQTYEAQQIPSNKKGDDRFVLHTNDDNKLEYANMGPQGEPEYTKEDMMLFPRIWYSNEENRKQFYSNWLNTDKEVLEQSLEPDGDGRYRGISSQRVVEVFNTKREADSVADIMNEQAKRSNQIAQKSGSAVLQYISRDHLTQKENINWLMGYQVNWMYWRYFMWNFAGKQNDIQGFSSKRDGNWLSGVSFIDNYRLGDQSVMPDTMKNNKANNHLYFLPFILGLIGLIFHFIKHRDDWLVNMLLFFMTGFAIVLYLNQYGLQPRERDYAFVGSFYAFAVWIGLGVLQVRDWFGNFTKGITPGVIAASICFIAVPALMCKVEWNDHDRSQKRTAKDLATCYLESCPQNAILFTVGDNDTYPLWYAQEVEGIRTDIRVVNTSLLGIDWYLDQLKYKVNESDAFKMIWTSKDYEGPKMDYGYLSPGADPSKLFSLDSLITASAKLTTITDNGISNGFAGRNYYVNINPASAKIFNLAPTDTLATRIFATIAEGKSAVTKGDFGILNIIAGNVNDRPICFTDDNGADVGQLGIKQFLRQQGMVYQYIPSTNFKKVETSETQKNILNKFAFTNAITKGVYYDEENRRHLESIRQACVKTAEALANEGNIEGAKAILKKIHEQMPSYSLPYGSPSRYDGNNTSSLNMVEVAYKAKEEALGKKIFNEVKVDLEQQMKYYYMLCNPSGKPTAENVAKFTEDLTLLKKYEFGDIRITTQQEYDKKLQLDAKIKKGMLNGFTFNDAIFSAKNYLTMLQIKDTYVEPKPNAVAPNVAPTAPLKIKDTTKQP